MLEHCTISNSSSVVNFPNLLPLLQTILNNKVPLFGSTLCSTLNPVSESAKIVCELYPNMRFAHGTCLLFDSSAMYFLLERKHQLRQDVEDDLGFSLLFTQTKEEHKEVFLPRSIGVQFAGYNSNYNLCNVAAFRNHHFGSDRLLDVANVANITAALQRRYSLHTHGKIENITYGAHLDITQFVLLLCKVVGSWTSDTNNAKLDYLFGDPSPGQPKVLHVTFSNKIVFAQGAALTFFLHNNELMVR